MYRHVCWCSGITQEGSSKVPTIIVQELRFDDARSRTVIGQLSKKRLTSSAFFLTVELFSTFF